MNNTVFDKLCQNHTLLNAWKIVKRKGASGGIDGLSIKEFDENLGANLAILKQELKAKTWKPEPYLRISIPKKDNEKRKLGLLCIKDKIVQQALKLLIEPRFEKIFVKNSYGYRPDKGHTRAIKFARFCCQNKKYPFILRLDIDNYFDTINHEILFRRIRSLITDEEILRLVQLCIKMGMVNKRLKWDEITEGIPQGAVLSPLLANYYLHSFDQFILSRTKMYVRYADDFIICCETREQAEGLLKEGSLFLEQRLKLHLNEPIISEIKDGFDFLGITLDNKKLSISEKKKEELHQKIKELDWDNRNFTTKGLESLQGIRNYYATLLPQPYLAQFDEVLILHLKQLITEKWELIPNKSVLQEALKTIEFYSEQNILQKGRLRGELVSHYLTLRTERTRIANEAKNKQLIKQRKKEYRKKENEATELIINSHGTYIGVNNKGITLKVYGKQQPMPPTNNLNHITVLCNGVSISSNAIDYCMQNKIPIDFFTNTGQHTASILSETFMQTSLWQKQALMPIEQRTMLSQKIISGKLRNQMNLIKYFHKYHKSTSVSLCNKYNEILPKLTAIIKSVNSYKKINQDYRSDIMGWEAAGAVLYWDYIRELISDDNVGFTHRERKGATDLVNCLLNYGYSILYARVWQALLFRKLNPMDSVIHMPQIGKPTFVFDVVELFRAQAVDRVVISLIQKGEPLKICKGLLHDTTKNLLVQNIVERFNRYEIYRNKECRLCDIINLQTKEIAEFISDNVLYRPYIAKW